MKKLNILLLGGAKRVSLAERFIASGKDRGYEVSIFSYELNENTPISFIGNIIKGKKWDDCNILEDLELTIKNHEIDILLPCVDPATTLAADLKLITKTNCFIPVSSPPLCQIFFDKQLTYNWSLNNEVEVPASNLEFPMIAKPNNGSASVGICIIKNLEEYNNFFLEKNKLNYNIQKFIDGIEYSVDVYVSLNSRKIISIVPRIRLEVLGGESIKSQTIKDLELINLSKDIAVKSGLVGPLVIQFIKDKKTGKIYLMEINPRFGGAVLCSIGAGVDFPGYVIDDMSGVNLNENQNDWEDNLLMVRRFTEFYIKK